MFYDIWFLIAFEKCIKPLHKLVLKLVNELVLTIVKQS